jgi:hypothetical protein
MNRKYTLTKENMKDYDKTLHRMQVIRNFANIKKGDMGGFVESEENVSYDGNVILSKKKYNNKYDFTQLNLKIEGIV